MRFELTTESVVHWLVEHDLMPAGSAPDVTELPGGISATELAEAIADRARELHTLAVGWRRGEERQLAVRASVTRPRATTRSGSDAATISTSATTSERPALRHVARTR